MRASNTPVSAALAALLASLPAALTLWPCAGVAQGHPTLTYEQRGYGFAGCLRQGTVNSYLLAVVNYGPATTLQASGAARELNGLVFTELPSNRTFQPSGAYLLDANNSRRDALAIEPQGRARLVLEVNLPDNPSTAVMKLPNRANSGAIGVGGLCQSLAAGQPLPWGGSSSSASAGGGGGAVGQLNNAVGRANNTLDRANSTIDRATQAADSATQAVGSINRLKDGLRGLFGSTGSAAPAATPAAPPSPTDPAPASPPPLVTPDKP